MKTVACIIARTNSIRLPKKVLLNINGKTVIEHIIERVKQVKGIDEIYIATSNHPEDKILGEIALRNGIKVFFGSENAVIERMLIIAELEKATNVIRITGDNIFTDPVILEKTLECHKERNVEYSRAEFLSIGVTAEVINVNALKRCYESIDPEQSEYLFYYIFNPDQYRTLVLVPESNYSKYEYSSLTIDTHADFDRTKFIFQNIDKDLILYEDILDLHERFTIENFEVDGELKIKLPNGNSMKYWEFRKIICERIKRSQIMKLKI